MAIFLSLINMFLVITEAINFGYDALETMPSQELMSLVNLWMIGQMTHILLGIFGLIAAIIVVVGTVNNVPGERLKLPLYAMTLAWTFNFLYGILILTTPVTV